MRLAAGRDDKWPVKEEAADTPLVKKEVEGEEMWRNGGYAQRGNPILGDNPEAKRRKVTLAGQNADIKEEPESFPAVTLKSVQTGGILTSMNDLFDNQVFNAHDLFTNEARFKEELEEEEEEGEEMDHTAEHNDLEKQGDMEKKCPVDGCSKKCLSDEDLAKHMLTHQHPFVCGVCKRSLPYASALRAHHKVHLGEKPFQCTHCTKKFSQSGHLKQHMRQHTGYRPYGCDECDRKFASYSALIYHLTLHTGEKDFACNLCDYRCTSTGDLTKHIRSHTGEKPFECTECGKCLSQKKHLERHKATVHEGLKKHACSECDYKTAYNHHLSRHMETIHKK